MARRWGGFFVAKKGISSARRPAASAPVAQPSNFISRAAPGKRKRSSNSIPVRAPDPVAGLTADGAGDLYGTLEEQGYYGYGSVFELYQSGHAWMTAIPWYFGNGTDGQNPECDLIRDKAGNIYGTTAIGGTAGDGTVFELSSVDGKWSERVLYSFGSSGSDDAALPSGGLVRDKSSTLYGTTTFGGAYNGGAVYKLVRSGKNWTESLLHSFGKGSDGLYPYAGLVIDGVGNLYGTTETGGSANEGIAFELSPSGFVWTESILHSFGGTGDGSEPVAALHLDPTGALYGTTEYGGAYGYGSVFELVQSGGVWSETIVHSFAGGDGYLPLAAVIEDPAGNLYGTTFEGGAYDAGTVFEISP